MWLKISLIACLVNFVQFSLALDLEEKVANLFSITSKQGIIRLDSDKFETYVRSRPRNYSVIAMTTALNPSRGCSVCHEAYNEYKILYNSYRQNSRQAFLDKGVFFALIDYDDASDVFKDPPNWHF